MRTAVAIAIVAGAYVAVVGGIVYEGTLSASEAAVASGENFEAYIASAHILLGPGIAALGSGTVGWSTYYEATC